MTSINRTMRPVEWSLLIALSLLWGGSFFCGQVALAELRPFTVVLGRVGIAAMALWILVLLSGERLPTSARDWRRFFTMGALNNLVPFSFLLWSQTRIPSSLASILNGTTPVFAVLLAHFLTRDERMTPGRVGGVLAGFLGLVVMVGPDAVGGSNRFAAELLALGGPLSYALAAIYGRRFQDTPPLIAATGQLTASTILAAPVALLVDRPWELGPIAPTTIAALVALALLSTALAYVIFFRLLATAGATNLMLVTLLVPVSALLLGTFILGERLAARELVGMGVIAIGLALIDGRALGWLRRLPKCLTIQGVRR